MSTQVSLVIFEGGPVKGRLEKQMQKIRQNIVLDLIDKARLAGFEKIIAVTSYPQLAEELQPMQVEVFQDQEQSGRPFHFGRCLWAVIQLYGLKKILYMGGAAAPLVSSSELKYMREILEGNEGILLANNYYSADIVGFSPGEALAGINLPPIDNTLALALSNEGGLRWIPLQRSLGLNFDLDTPTDLLIMSVHPDLGSRAQAAVQELSWDLSNYLAIKDLLNDATGELLVYGRVGSNFFQYLDSHTRCRLRLYSEERGMKALGRDQRGQVVSILGRLAEELGFTGFFQFLSEIARGAVLDSRVLFEHFRWNLSQADRFASDLGELDLISHPGLRQFTAAALEASIPVLLGGHSLVTGGLWALIDAGLRQEIT
ncbi:MAG: hypothetical protein GX335_07710 [Firmicutes bacterium]|nr:hypothetical protein [Bacillota bacterium]